MPGPVDHFEADSSRAARRRADLQRLRTSRRPRLLLVTHASAGGVRRHVDAQVADLSNDFEVLVLQPNETSPVTPPAFAMLRWANPGEELRAWFHKARDWRTLVSLLAALGISRVHFHHVHALPPEVLDLGRALGCPVGYTFHDYHPICPQYHLVDGSGHYCGEPHLDCRRCHERGPPPWPLTIPEWRAAFRQVIASADVLIAPSRDCAARMQRYFHDAGIHVIPHESGPAPAALRVTRVVVPGAISAEKGLDLLDACVEDAIQRSLPLHFIVAGYVGRPLVQWPTRPLEVTGEYPEGSLPARLATLAPDAIFFPAQCPETYSFTLDDAIAWGAPLVATDLGAIGERLRGRQGCAVLPWDSPAAVFNDQLLSARPRQAPPETAAPGAAATTRSPIPRDCPARAPTAALPVVEDAHWRDPLEPLARPSLVQLFDDGVVCGRKSSRDSLRQRAAAADAAETQAHAEIVAARQGEQRATTDAAESRLEQQRVSAELQALRASTSWRLTAPLRWMVTRLRRRDS